VIFGTIIITCTRSRIKCTTANFNGRNPDLSCCGELKMDFKPFNQECHNGRIFLAFAETPPGSPYRYILLTMDRENFAGMPTPNWTCGAVCFYGANS